MSPPRLATKQQLKAIKTNDSTTDIEVDSDVDTDRSSSPEAQVQLTSVGKQQRKFMNSSRPKLAAVRSSRAKKRMSKKKPKATKNSDSTSDEALAFDANLDKGAASRVSAQTSSVAKLRPRLVIRLAPRLATKCSSGIKKVSKRPLKQTRSKSTKINNTTSTRDVPVIPSRTNNISTQGMPQPFGTPNQGMPCLHQSNQGQNYPTQWTPQPYNLPHCPQPSCTVQPNKWSYPNQYVPQPNPWLSYPNQYIPQPNQWPPNSNPYIPQPNQWPPNPNQYIPQPNQWPPNQYVSQINQWPSYPNQYARHPSEWPCYNALQPYQAGAHHPSQGQNLFQQCYLIPLKQITPTPIIVDGPPTQARIKPQEEENKCTDVIKLVELNEKADALAAKLVKFEKKPDQNDLNALKPENKAALSSPKSTEHEMKENLNSIRFIEPENNLDCINFIGLEKKRVPCEIKLKEPKNKVKNVGFNFIKLVEREKEAALNASKVIGSETKAVLNSINLIEHENKVDAFKFKEHENNTDHLYSIRVIESDNKEDLNSVVEHENKAGVIDHKKKAAINTTNHIEHENEVDASKIEEPKNNTAHLYSIKIMKSDNKEDLNSVLEQENEAGINALKLIDLLDHDKEVDVNTIDHIDHEMKSDLDSTKLDEHVRKACNPIKFIKPENNIDLNSNNIRDPEKAVLNDTLEIEPENEAHLNDIKVLKLDNKEALVGEGENLITTLTDDKDKRKDDPVTEETTLSYKEGKFSDQWSVLNLEGKKKYDREFLMQLKTVPLSCVKPENLPDKVAKGIPDEGKKMGKKKTRSKNKGNKVLPVHMTLKKELIDNPKQDRETKCEEVIPVDSGEIKTEATALQTTSHGRTRNNGDQTLSQTNEGTVTPAADSQPDEVSETLRPTREAETELEMRKIRDEMLSRLQTLIDLQKCKKGEDQHADSASAMEKLQLSEEDEQAVVHKPAPTMADGAVGSSEEDITIFKLFSSGDSNKETFKTVGKNSCVMCVEKQRACALIPCGHRAYCEDCCRRLVHLGQSCVLCRQVPEGYLPIHL